MPAAQIGAAGIAFRRRLVSVPGSARAASPRRSRPPQAARRGPARSAGTHG